MNEEQILITQNEENASINETNTETVQCNYDELLTQINNNIIANNTISLCSGIILTAIFGLLIVKALFKKV